MSLERAIKIQGKKVSLSPLEESDARLFQQWLNDLEVAKTLNIAEKIYTIKDELDYLKKAIKEKHAVNLGIIDNQTRKTIGSVGLKEISGVHRRAELGIFIGDKKYWGRHYGREAIILLLDYAFNVLNLHTISLSVYSYNQRAIRAYQAIGFQPTGKLREARFWGGKYYNIIIMDILDREFKASKIKDLIRECQQK